MKLSTPLLSQRGFSLLEVLVTSMIVAIGVVGLVTVQMQQLRSTRAALVSSQAAILVNDISERMRVNVSQVSAATYTTAYSQKAINLAGSTDDCKAGGCTADKMAKFDLLAWKNALEKLPAGGGAISMAANVATITIYWDQDNSGSTTTTCPPENVNDLDCLQITLGEIN